MPLPPLPNEGHFRGMKTLTPLLAITLSLGSPAASAQAPVDDPSTLGAVRDVVELYIEGQATFDPDVMRKAFDPGAYLVYQKEGALFFERSDAYIQRLPGKPAIDEAQRKRRIVELHSTPTTGYAVLEFDYPSGRFIEHLLIARDTDGWFIVAKTFHRFPAGGEDRK